MDNKAELIEQLFTTEAFRVSDPKAPFWYTSGKFGPYYINTHFLFENEKEAAALLTSIDYTLKYPLALPRIIGSACIQKYNTCESYRGVIDELSRICSAFEFDYISGGARRDYFFSYAVAEKLGKEHLSILKDGSMYHSTCGFSHSRAVKTDDFLGKKVVHIADLVTEASSYFRAWLPALENSGVQITESVVVIDRKQGGKEALAEQGIALFSLINIEPDFFSLAKQLGKIDEEQEKQLLAFYENPDRFMLDFLNNNPSFLAEEEARDAKTAERVERFRQLNLL